MADSPECDKGRHNRCLEKACDCPCHRQAAVTERWWHACALANDCATCADRVACHWLILMAQLSNIGRGS